MIVGPGANFESTLLPPGAGGGVGVGAANMTGVIGFGAWNEYSSAEARTFTEAMVDFNWLGLGRYALDWWGAAPYYAGLQCFQQAIERAGELDNLKVRNELAEAGWTTDPFDTVLGYTWFSEADGTACGSSSGGLLAKECYLGQIGQWQHVTEANGWLPDGVTGTTIAKPYGIGDATKDWWIFDPIDVSTSINLRVTIVATVHVLEDGVDPYLAVKIDGKFPSGWEIDDTLESNVEVDVPYCETKTLTAKGTFRDPKRWDMLKDCISKITVKIWDWDPTIILPDDLMAEGELDLSKETQWQDIPVVGEPPSVEVKVAFRLEVIPS
jgi:hypothetical protein